MSHLSQDLGVSVLAAGIPRVLRKPPSCQGGCRDPLGYVLRLRTPMSTGDASSTRLGGLREPATQGEVENTPPLRTGHSLSALDPERGDG